MPRLIACHIARGTAVDHTTGIALVSKRRVRVMTPSGSHLGAGSLPGTLRDGPRTPHTNVLNRQNSTPPGVDQARPSFGTKRSWVQIPPPRQLQRQVRPGAERSAPGLICVAAPFWGPLGSQLGVIFRIRPPVASSKQRSPRLELAVRCARSGRAPVRLVPSNSPQTVRRSTCTDGLR